jgi:hypothetical protein
MVPSQQEQVSDEDKLTLACWIDIGCPIDREYNPKPRDWLTLPPICKNSFFPIARCRCFPLREAMPSSVVQRRTTPLK